MTHPTEAAGADAGCAESTFADDVVVRRLSSHAEYEQALALQDETWGPDFAERVPTAILMIAQKIGGVCAGAFDGDGRLLGFVFGLSGFRDGRAVHWSDMLAVRADVRGRHIGERLKQFQRECVRAVGCRAMLWTYDPLMARNAHFNLQRLGGSAVEYIENLYGVTTSVLHGGIPTDRFVVQWEIDGPVAPALDAAAVAEWREAPFVVAVGAGEVPIATPNVEAPRVRVAIPEDMERLQAADQALALRWRLATREAFTAALALGYVVRGFQRATAASPGAYLLDRPDTPRTQS
jgi:chorismate synthase